MKVDVVVIGGGPAGSSAAIRLARTGRKVRLYERAHFPRPKLCGGFLSPEGLQDLEDLHVLSSLRRTGAVSLHRTVIASPGGALIESELPEEALSVSRDILDDLLLHEARWAGAEIVEGEDGVPHLDEAPVQVIATGRLVSAREHVRQNPYFGIQSLFRDARGVSDQVELDLVENGYVGLARQAKGVNVCALTTQKTVEKWGPSLDQVMAHFMTENPVLKDHLKEAARISDWMAVGPVRLGIRRLAHETTFYVGDAACVVDPFAGEGMSIGLYTSRLLVNALTQTDKPADQAYAAMWRKAFVPALRWNAAMRLLYSIPLIREPTLHALQWFPHAMNWMTDLTRYRRLESL